MQLDAVEREALAEELLLSLSEDEREEIDAAWLEEAKRRHKAFLDAKGTANSVEDAVSAIKTI